MDAKCLKELKDNNQDKRVLGSLQLQWDDNRLQASS